MADDGAFDDLDSGDASDEYLLRYEEQQRQALEEHRRFVSSPDHVVMLKNAGAAFLAPETLIVGALVTWKPGLKNRRYPLIGEPAVIVEILDDAVTVEREPDDESLAEHLDLRLGVLLEPEMFRVFHFDSRRFTAFTPA